MLLSPGHSVRGHDHRPQHPTTSHHLRGHCRGEHGATLTSPPSALPRLLRRLTHCPRRLLFWVLFCQYSRVPFSYSSLRVIITRCPSTRIVTITTILHLSPNIFLMLKYFYRVKYFHRTGVLCPGARSARDWWRCADQGTTGSVAPPRHCSHSPYLAHCRMSPPLGIIQGYCRNLQTAGILGYPD